MAFVKTLDTFILTSNNNSGQIRSDQGPSFCSELDRDRQETTTEPPVAARVYIFSARQLNR